MVIKDPISSITSIINYVAPIEGYCWPLSAFPGESINFFVSASYNYIFDYVRLTDLDENGSGTPLISKGEQTAFVQPVPDNAWRDGCGWAPTHHLIVPADWPSGFYAARLTSTGVTTAFIVFIVKPKDIHGDHLVLASSLTWNAYNTRGGRSRYEPELENTFSLSFLRPNYLATPLFPHSYSVPAQFVPAELWVLKWMKEEGHNADVITDQDFHFGLPFLHRYVSIIINSHPEYWTQTMYDRLKDYLNIGGCFLNLGGNSLFERVILNDDGSTIMFHGENPTPNSYREKQYFRNLNPPQPEREILGVAFLYEDAISHYAPYAVLLPDHRFFNGTGVAFMSEIGASGRDGVAASGYEMDSSRAGHAAPGVIVDAKVNGTDRGNPPPNLQVLARGKNEQVEGQGQHAAEMTYYDTSAGGFVLSAGSFTFAGSLVEDSILQKIVNNAMWDSMRVRDERLSLKHILFAKGIPLPVAILNLAENYGLAPPFLLSELMQRLLQV
jgi:N,N-dimethylformamidase beta subunit-like, C-terminal